MKRLIVAATLLASTLCGVLAAHSYDQLYCDGPTITSSTHCWAELTTYYA